MVTLHSLYPRLPRHPVMNSPVVSISVYNNQTFVGGHLDQPILLEFKLLETANRSKPLCVQWNHSSLWVQTTVTLVRIFLHIHEYTYYTLGLGIISYWYCWYNWNSKSLHYPYLLYFCLHIYCLNALWDIFCVLSPFNLLNLCNESTYLYGALLWNSVAL